MLSSLRNRSKRIEWLIAGILLLVVAVLFGPMGIYQLRRLEPPADVRTINDFARRMPAPRRLEIVEVQGEISIVWVGELARFPALPSGPPAYQFDRTGRLVDWCVDNGEGHLLGHLAFRGKEVTLAEALELTNAAH